jgi:hypothetical protein
MVIWVVTYEHRRFFIIFDIDLLSGVYLAKMKGNYAENTLWTPSKAILSILDIAAADY